MPLPYPARLIQQEICGESGDVSRLVGAILAGLPFGELTDLRAALDLPMERVAAQVGMSRATLHRRQKTGILSTDESDKTVRLARLVGQAMALFEDAAAARAWLNAPQHGLGGATPLDYAATEVGAREVEHLLGRIDHGVYA